MDVVVTGLTKDRARIMEQTFIALYSLGYLENIRNEIAAGNISQAWEAQQDFPVLF